MPAPGTSEYDFLKVRHFPISHLFTYSPPPRRNQPFRFLDLPKDIRLMIYDFIPIVTHHHRITLRRYDEDHTVTIISKHVPGIHLLATYRKIYSEATLFRARLQGPSTEPLRLIMHWRMISGAILRAVLRCASKEDDCCPGSSDVDAVLHEVQRHGEGKMRSPCELVEPQSMYSLASLLTSNFVPRDTNPVLVYSDFTTHVSLHTLLRRRPALGTRRTVEIAITCPESLHTGRLRMECTLFYNWLVEMHHGWVGDVDMHILLRPMPATYGVKMGLELDYGFWNQWNPPSAFRDRSWSYEVGEWLENEFEMSWEEGKRCGRGIQKGMGS